MNRQLLARLEKLEGPQERFTSHRPRHRKAFERICRKRKLDPVTLEPDVDETWRGLTNG
jgi:hypothetical protein